MVESGELPEPTLPEYMRSVSIHFNSIALEWVRMEAENASLRKMARGVSVPLAGSWGYEIASKQLHWSDEVYRIFGVSRGDLCLELALSFYPPQAREKIEKVFNRALNEGIGWEDVEADCITSDGTHLVTHSRGWPQMDASGTVIRVVGTFKDITPRLRVVG